MSDSGWIKAVCAKTDQTRYPPKLADSWGNLALKPREITIQELFDRGEFDFLGHEGFWGYPDRVAAHDAFRGREPVPARIVDRFPRYKIVPGETFTNHSWTDKVVAALGYSSFKYHHKDLGHELVMGLTWPLNVLGKVVGWGIHYLNEELVDPLNSPYHGKSFEERFVHETVNIVDDWHHDFPGGMFDYEKNFEKYNKHQNVGNWLRGLGETIGLGSVIGAFDDENKNRSIFWKIVNVEEGLIQLILMVESFGALSKVFRAGGALTMDLATAYARTTEGLADSVARDLNFTSGALEPPAFEEPSLPARPKPPQKSEVDLVSTPKEQLSLEEKDQLYELRKKQKEIERQVLEQPPPLEPIEEGDEEGDDYFINNINAKYGSRVHPPQSELAPVPDLTEPVPDLTQKRRLSNQALFDDSRDVLGRAQAAESLADETLERMRQVSQEASQQVDDALGQLQDVPDFEPEEETTEQEPDSIDDAYEAQLRRAYGLQEMLDIVLRPGDGLPYTEAFSRKGLSRKGFRGGERPVHRPGSGETETETETDLAQTETETETDLAQPVPKPAKAPGTSDSEFSSRRNSLTPDKMKQRNKGNRRGTLQRNKGKPKPRDRTKPVSERMNLDQVGQTIMQNHMNKWDMKAAFDRWMNLPYQANTLPNSQAYNMFLALSVEEGGDIAQTRYSEWLQVYDPANKPTGFDGRRIIKGYNDSPDELVTKFREKHREVEDVYEQWLEESRFRDNRTTFKIFVVEHFPQFSNELKY